MVGGNWLRSGIRELGVLRDTSCIDLCVKRAALDDMVVLNKILGTLETLSWTALDHNVEQQ